MLLPYLPGGLSAIQPPNPHLALTFQPGTELSAMIAYCRQGVRHSFCSSSFPEVDVTSERGWVCEG